MELKDADKILNIEYEKLMNRVHIDYVNSPDLGAKLKSHIKKSQIAWLKVRDENCLIESFFVDPTAQIYEAITNSCKARESNARSSYLRKLKF